MEKREVTVYKETFGRRNSLQGWRHVRSPARLLYNYILTGTAKRAPSIRLKNVLYRLAGVKIGKNVAIAAGVMLDFFFPELIEIGDNVIIGYNTTILTHEFLHNEWRKGAVKIGDNVLIGAWTLVMPGAAVGNDAQVAAFSLVNKKVQAGERVGGVPIQKLKENPPAQKVKDPLAAAEMFGRDNTNDFKKLSLKYRRRVEDVLV